MKVFVFGNIKSCGKCRAYAGKTSTGAPTKPASGIEAGVISALTAEGIAYAFYDYGTIPAAYNAAKRALGISSIPKYPAVYVADEANAVKGKFLATTSELRPFTAATMVAKIKAICPECFTGCGDECGEVFAHTCPKCGHKFND